MEHNPDVSHQDGGWSWSQTWARIVCGVFASSRGLKTRASTEVGKEMPQE